MKFSKKKGLIFSLFLVVLIIWGLVLNPGWRQGIYSRLLNLPLKEEIAEAPPVVQPPTPSGKPVQIEAPVVEEKPTEVKEAAPPTKAPLLVTEKIDTDGDGIPDTFIIRGQEERGREKKVAPRAKNLRVTFIDVGQGDSCLIQTPGGRNIIIDGSIAKQGKKVLSLLEEKRIRKIDCIVATHPEADHVGGLITVLNNFEIGEVLDIGIPHTTRTYEDFLRLIEKKNINYRIVRRGNTLDWGEEVSVQVLNPPEELLGSTNESSIVLRLVYGKISFLFTGDIGRQAEEDLVDTYSGSIDVLIWNNLFYQIPQRDSLIQGTSVQVSGEIGSYQGKFQIKPGSPSDIQIAGVAPAAPAAPVAVPVAGVTPISSITQASVGQKATLKGTIVSVYVFKSGEGRTVKISDGSGSGKLKVTVLKCPHHGSRGSSTSLFLGEVRPEVVVISAGRDNPYGHPTEEALDRYRKIGTKIYRTDVNGNIVVTSDGGSYQITTE